MASLSELDDPEGMQKALDIIFGVLRTPSNDGGNSGVELTPQGIEAWIDNGHKATYEQALAIVQQDAQPAGGK